MVITILKTTFPKESPKIITYRDFSSYKVMDFKQNLKENLDNKNEKTYEKFEEVFLNTLDSHAPQKKKTLRANQKPYVTKEMRKAIMTRSQLQNKVYKYGSEYSEALRKQKNYCNRLYKRERKNYYSNLNVNNVTDNKKFWNTMKPLFSDKGGVCDKIVLVENNEIISDDTHVAETFNNFFANAVDLLGITENKHLLNNPVHNSIQGVENTIKMYETHPSIISIKSHV
jgi:ABC-type antimicrobial peptide transport system permease subunit